MAAYEFIGVQRLDEVLHVRCATPAERESRMVPVRTTVGEAKCAKCGEKLVPLTKHDRCAMAQFLGHVEAQVLTTPMLN